MQNDLRQLRLKAGLTQKQIAEALCVPLSTYRRWETGSSKAPKDISAKLTAIMGTPVRNVLEGSPPREPDITDDEWEDISFYGHMVVHFQGAGQPLILSLDIDEYARTYRLLQEQRKFITISSTHNETVIVRTAAVADVFFSHSEYADCGPEVSVRDLVSNPFYDDDWSIIEEIAKDEMKTARSGHESYLRVRTQLASLGDITHAIAVLTAGAPNHNNPLATIFERATRVIYQLAGGRKRSVPSTDGAILEAFWMYIDNSNSSQNDYILFPAEGFLRTIFINFNAVDYITVPTHQFNRAANKAIGGGE